MNFNEIAANLKNSARKSIAVAAAQDADVLRAVSMAVAAGLAKPVLIGDTEAIKRIAEESGIDLSGAELIEERLDPVKRAVTLVRAGEADVLMKGMIQTADLLRGVLNKEWGLRAGDTLSHVALFKSAYFDRLLFMSDAAMCMYPDLKQKTDILKNAVAVARALGINTPKVACIAAVEVVNPAMQATLDAAALTLMAQRGQLKGCMVDGPLALDNALSAEAAAHKKIVSSVAGAADILLMPNIEAGNVFFKAAHYLGHTEMAGLIAGAKAPIVLTSRTDTPETKLNSIITALKVAAN